ncbi:MAG: HepT-like ribonuclease domain-containing protein [Burkholderiaceae bacterium]
MKNRLPKHLFDALTAVRLAREFSTGLSFGGFEANVLVRSAVERQLEILGEACQRMVQVDPDIRRRVPELGFAIGLRNKIIHPIFLSHPLAKAVKPRFGLGAQANIRSTM